MGCRFPGQQIVARVGSVYSASSIRLYTVTGDDLLVQVEAEPRPIRYRNRAIGSDLDCRLEQFGDDW